MKHLILWGSVVVVGILVSVLWEKTTVSTIFDPSTSPLYVDTIIFLIGLSMVIGRGIALFRKVFR